MRKLTKHVIESVQHAINTTHLRTAGILSADRSGIIRWQDGRWVSFQSLILEPDNIAQLELRWLVNGQWWGREYAMMTCRTDFRRWGAMCCGKLHQHLYFVPGGFSCRRCGGLGYASQRSSHARWRAMQQLRAGGVQCLSEGSLIALAKLDEWSLNRTRLPYTIEPSPITRPRTEGGAIMRA